MNPVVLGIVISPDLKKPKKHRIAAAQIMTISGSLDLDSRVDRIDLRMAGVTGNLTRVGCGACSEWVR